MGYDSGIKPGEQACTIAGCTATHDEDGELGEGRGRNVGYYAPLKENTNRFVKQGQRLMGLRLGPLRLPWPKADAGNDPFWDSSSARLLATGVTP